MMVHLPPTMSFMAEGLIQGDIFFEMGFHTVGVALFLRWTLATKPLASTAGWG